MRFFLARYAEDGILASMQSGQKVFAALISDTTAPAEPTLFYIDFEGVSVATTSFLRESVVAYRNLARAKWPNIYPLAANLNERVREELHNFLLDRGDALLACKLDRRGRPVDVQMLGQLDGKQRETLHAVLSTGETDAPRLAERFRSKQDVGPTAWNNRLSALAAKGLLIETASGRTKRYRPVVEDSRYGA